MILVHICCSVDSHFFLQKLREEYPKTKLVGYFYNPNIHPKSEYDLRLLDVKHSCDMLNIELIDDEYDQKSWIEDTINLEHEPEKHQRCVKCFKIRLLKTALYAKTHQFRAITTTLLASPMKEFQILRALGEDIAKSNGIEFISINVREHGGAQEQAILAKKDNLYRQNYCGCEFALNAQRKRQNKISLELFEPRNKQFLPASNEARMRVFARRNELEQANQPYILYKRSILAWRNIRSWVRTFGNMVDSYVIANSMSKNHVKMGTIAWKKITLEENIFLSFLQHHFMQEQAKSESSTQNSIKSIESKRDISQVSIGFASRDDSVFVSIDSLNSLLGSSYKSVRELYNKTLSYEEELFLRLVLCAPYSINPIIIVDERIQHNVSVLIESIYQEENVFEIRRIL